MLPQLAAERFQVSDQVLQRQRVRVADRNDGLPGAALVEEHERVLVAEPLRDRPQILGREPRSARKQHDLLPFPHDLVVQHGPVVRLESGTVERKRVGSSESRSAAAAPASPVSARCRSRTMRAETSAISDMASSPLNPISSSTRIASPPMSVMLAHVPEYCTVGFFTGPSSHHDGDRYR